MLDDKSITIPIRLKRSARGIMLQHMLAGIALLLTVLEFLGDQENPHKFVLAIEGIVAIILVIAIIRELRHLKKGHFQSSIWVDILAAGVIFCEALNKYLEHHVRLAIAWWFVTALTLATGFIRPRVRGRRYMVVSTEQIKLKLWILKSQTISLGSILSIIKTPSKIEINLKSGESWVIELGEMLNAGELSEKLYSACRESGLSSDTLIGFERD